VLVDIPVVLVDDADAQRVARDAASQPVRDQRAGGAAAEDHHVSGHGSSERRARRLAQE